MQCFCLYNISWQRVIDHIWKLNIPIKLFSSFLAYFCVTANFLNFPLLTYTASRSDNSYKTVNDKNLRWWNFIWREVIQLFGNNYYKVSRGTCTSIFLRFFFVILIFVSYYDITYIWVLMQTHLCSLFFLYCFVLGIRVSCMYCAYTPSVLTNNKFASRSMQQQQQQCIGLAAASFCKCGW